MNKFMLLLIQAGEGCGHGLDCGKTWIELEGCTDMEGAMTMARLKLVPTGDPDHETSADLEGLASGRILEIADSRIVNIQAWKDGKQADDDNREKEAVKLKDMELIKALKEKYPDEF